jgi:hypothetical protein
MCGSANCTACGAWRSSTDFGAAEALDGRCRRCRWLERFPGEPRERSSKEIRRRNAVKKGNAVWAWAARAWLREVIERAGGVVALAWQSGVSEKTLQRLLSEEAMRVDHDAMTIEIGTIDRIALADGRASLEDLFPLPQDEDEELSLAA